MFPKVHMSNSDLVQLLADRGLTIADPVAAEAVLRRTGYHRFGAYVYPFREFLPSEEQQVKSRVHLRSDAIRAGVTFEQVAALCDFDAGLRHACLQALSSVEIALQAHIADTLGARDVFAHANRSALDGDACAKPHPDSTKDQFDFLQERLAHHQRDARKKEDAVVHHESAYGGPLPIWTAVNIADFGSLTRLFSLARKDDQNAVAAMLGVKTGSTLNSWLKQLNYLRNLCAHNNRLWNRALTVKVVAFKPVMVRPELEHAATMNERDRVYLPLALLAYLTQQIDARSRWHLHLRECVRKFPTIESATPEKDMGFPQGWDQMPLWNRIPPSR
jgi:abortive infection bacteriophage resistance protein